MTSSDPNYSGALEDWVFLALLLIVSLAFLWIVTPFYGAILWGIVIAMEFQNAGPLFRE